MANETKLREQIEFMRAQRAILSMDHAEILKYEKDPARRFQKSPTLEQAVKIIKFNQSNIEAKHKIFVNKMDDIMRKPTAEMIYKVHVMVSVRGGLLGRERRS